MFREVCVVYVSLSGEHMVSFVQSVEKSITSTSKRIRTATSRFGLPSRRGAQILVKEPFPKRFSNYCCCYYLLFDDTTNGCIVVVNL